MCSATRLLAYDSIVLRPFPSLRTVVMPENLPITVARPRRIFTDLPKIKLVFELALQCNNTHLL